MLLFRFSRATLNIFLFNNGHNLYSSTHSLMINRNDNFNVKNERNVSYILLYILLRSTTVAFMCTKEEKNLAEQIQLTICNIIQI